MSTSKKRLKGEHSAPVLESPMNLTIPKLPAAVSQATSSSSITTARSLGGALRSYSYEQLPTSVRNVPPELRTAVRRKQNNESFKRSRDRKRHEMEELERQSNNNANHIASLEKQILQLESTLAAKKKARKRRSEEAKARDADLSSPLDGNESDKQIDFFAPLDGNESDKQIDFFAPLDSPSSNCEQ